MGVLSLASDMLIFRDADFVRGGLPLSVAMIVRIKPYGYFSLSILSAVLIKPEDDLRSLESVIQ